MTCCVELASTLLAGLKCRAGHDPVLGRMIREGSPLTAEEYIKAQWLGDPPDDLSAYETEIIALFSAYELLRQDAQARWCSDCPTMSRH